MPKPPDDVVSVRIDLNKILQLSDVLHRRWLDSPESRDLSTAESVSVVNVLLCRMAHVCGTPAEVMATNVIMMAEQLDSMRAPKCLIVLPTDSVH